MGHDELGAELLGFAAAKGLRTGFVQRSSTHATGVVQANVNNAHEVTYHIVQPVAWDYIQPDPALDLLVSQAELFVFGSLAARSPVSRETLHRLLGQARFRVFDVNLRPPHYTRAGVEYLLGKADLVKLNHHELTEIMDWFGQPTEYSVVLPWLAERFGLQAVCVTCGADGALLWTNGSLHRAPGVPVNVQDTIGSGDAFLAALLQGWLAGQQPEANLRFACASGALVATRAGATPTFTAADVAQLLAK
ncbi:hypothetical protein GCM10023186_25490 [Hymenobacter koreensis]|uniref:Carbohydrate kinase PfkB domain-containing protein n=1 Tax=Hymenobacter koreensis TaxID=1084523 RepID=A0ABP8J2R8_9BACT